MPNLFLKWFDLTVIYPRFVYTPYDNPIPVSGVRVNLSSDLLARLSSI